VVRSHARVAVTLAFPDGSPVIDADVAVSPRPGSDYYRRFTAVAGIPGLFESGPIEPPGENELSIRVRGWPTETRKIIVSPGVRNEIAIRLQDGLGVEGVVVDAEGSPIEGVEVGFLVVREEEQFADAQTDTDALGRFRLRGLADEQGTLVCANDDPRYLPSTTEARPGQPPVRVALERRPRIVGRLDPVPASLRLDAALAFEGCWIGAGVRVARDGRFEVRNVAIPAEQEFWLRLDGESRVPWIFLGLVLAPDETLDLGVLRPPEGVTLTGTVADAGGNPIVHANICAWAAIDDLDVDGGACTDARGRFAIADLADVPLEVRADRAGYAPLTLHVERPSAAPPLAIVLEPGGALEVAATPWAQEGVEVEAVDGSFRESYCTSKDKPTFVWLKPGAYRVNDETLEIRVGETTRFELPR
jgi:hypothetical protein